MALNYRTFSQNSQSTLIMNISRWRGSQHVYRVPQILSPVFLPVGLEHIWV